MNAIIVDDVLDDINVVREYIHRYFPEIKIVGEADNLPTAELMIKERNPKIVFLDIQMDRDGATSFQMLEKMGKENIDFEIIFITAHGKAAYQTKAMQYSNLRFLLKPLDPSVFKIAVEEAMERKGGGIYKDQIGLMLEMLKQADKSNIKMVIERIGGRSEIVRVGDIVNCVADGSTTKVHLVDGKVFVAAKNLGFYEKLFTEHYFYRISNKEILNLLYATSLDNGEKSIKCKIEGKEKEYLCSRRNWKGFKEFIKNNEGKLPNLAGAGLLDNFLKLFGK